MKPFRAAFIRFAGLFRRRSLEAQMNEELRAHLDGLIERNLAAGMSRDEARFAALRAFGGTAQIQERARDERRSVWAEQVSQDLGYALRQVRKHPGFASVVVLILGLGIGANTAVFSALEVLLLRPLPVRAPQELAIVAYVAPPVTGAAPVASPYLPRAFFEHVSEHGKSFVGVLALNGSGGSRVLTLPGAGSSDVVRVRTSDVSGSYFSVLQVQPRLGRLIGRDDDRKGSPRAVAVLSHAFWQRQFGGDPGIIGKSVLIEKVAFDIIGVAPEGFSGVRIGEPIDVWTPLWMLPAVNPRLGSNLAKPNWSGLHVMGRLRPEVTREAAAVEVNLMHQQAVAASRPDIAPADRTRIAGSLAVQPGAGGFVSEARAKGGPILGIMLVVVVLVQVLACANVASLSLARLAARRRELAARTALGASRGRIVRQLLTEALLLVAGGAVLGLLLVHWGFLAARARGIEASPGGWILLFALGMSLLTGVVVALVPALRSSRIDLTSELKSQGSTVAGGGRPRLQQMLVILQLAVCGCLLVGTGYFVRTVQALRHVDLGFEPDKLLLVAIETPGDYDAPRRKTLAQDLLRGVAAVPGVARATTSTTGLLSGGTSAGTIGVEGYTPQADEDMTARFVFAGPDFFATLGLPLVRGRGLEFADVFSPTNPAKVVINEAMVRRFFGATDPIGRRIRWGKSEFEIVGVARNSKYRSLREENPLICYIPLPQAGARLSLQVRTESAPHGLVSAVTAAIRQKDPNARILYTQTMDDVMRQATGDERMTAVGVGAFSVLALLLTSLGLYGLLAYNVTQRTREIGVRMALGGRPGNIIALILKQGLALTVIGWAVGIIAAMGLVRFVASRLYGVSGSDPLVLIGSGALLVAVAMLACWLPARRATKIDPMIALRAE